ncbi:hypothetical protein, partial [Bacillus xiamenensis]|uniref:hypothetical protein n=1 Tax=Bacillus xiamenensis TaxID=1178537 RepID=UPI001ED9B7CE
SNYKIVITGTHYGDRIRVLVYTLGRRELRLFIYVIWRDSGEKSHFRQSPDSLHFLHVRVL